MRINTEQDVRRWLKRVAGDRVFWVEPASGSNPGLPDAYLATWQPVWLELKVGHYAYDQERLRYEIRATQKQTMRRLINAGTPVGLLVGIKGKSQLALVQVSDRTIDGRAECASDVLFSCSSTAHIEPCYLSQLIIDSDHGELLKAERDQLVNAFKAHIL
jgi:hypothetical protein